MALHDKLFAEIDAVRYVAVYAGGEPQLYQRDDIKGASDSVSDRFEELLVNPAILCLAKQRGDIDCGGLQYVLIRYGNFFQFITKIGDGHISIALNNDVDLNPTIKKIFSLIG